MKPKLPMKPKPSKVTRITIARLYSLGNYEHVRYEITAEVPKGGSAKRTLLDLTSILGRLRPVKKPYEYERAKEVLGKPESERTESEKDRLEEYAECVRQYDAGMAFRWAAIEMLDAVGGSSKHTDAKDNWDDDPSF